MSSRDEILNAIRAQRVAPAELPSLDQAWIRYDDPLAQFRQTLEGVGGRFERAARASDIPAILASEPTFAIAQRIVSRVPAVAGNYELDNAADPHELETIDWAILPGQFGVAENAAIWVTDAQLKHRVIYFIVQHLALVLPTNQLVHNMHEAYERLLPENQRVGAPPAPQQAPGLGFGQSSLGLFLSGPSKTADIEQSLVIGAHGPRSLTVFCVDELY